jgi:hypothetical protein
VKTDLIKDMFKILQMSVEHRKRIHNQLKAEQKAAIAAGGFYKRLTVKEHLERVKFNPHIVERMDPSNGFRLIFPRAEGEDDTKYDKYLRKAHEIWQVTTGTLKTCDVKASNNSGIPKKKKKPKKKLTTTANAPPVDPALADAGDEGEALSSRMGDISNQLVEMHSSPTHNIDKRSSSNINGVVAGGEGGTQFFEKRQISAGVSKTQSSSAGSSANVKASAKQVTSRLYP